MRSLMTCVSVAALIVTAACSREDAAETNASVESEESVPAETGHEALMAQAADPAKIAHDRHENFEEMGEAIKGISDILKTDTPSVETIRAHAATIAGFTPQIITWFPAGSGPGQGFKTHAKQEIWDNPAEFTEKWRNLSAASDRFSAAAQQGDVDAIRTALGELGKSCKDCHDRFRVPE